MKGPRSKCFVKWVKKKHYLDFIVISIRDPNCHSLLSAHLWMPVAGKGIQERTDVHEKHNYRTNGVKFILLTINHIFEGKTQ